MKKAFFLLALVSLSFASLLWQFGTDGPVSAKPVIHQNMVVVASDDGYVYGLDPSTGAKRWQTAVGGTPEEPIVADNAVYVPVSEGQVIKLGSNGLVQWTVDLSPKEPHNVSRIYGIGVTPNTIFVTANNGLYALDKNGNVRDTLMTFNDSVLTAPATGQDYAIFGKEDELIRVSQTGIVQWRTDVDGPFWLSNPVIDDGTVYVGALDNKLHAFAATNGLELWDVRAKSWVTGTPIVEGGMVYFGSNDGNVYAVGSGNGILRWNSPTQLAVISQAEAGIMGGGEVVFVGSTDRNIYAMSRNSGEILWKGSAAGAIGSPLFYQNKVIFGAGDGKVYAYSTERACSITNPLEADNVGLKELEVRGKYVSEAGNAKVLIQVNGGEWMEAETGEVDWLYYIDPSVILAPGINAISCQVADAGGSEAGPTYTTVIITHDSTAPLSDLVVTVSPSIVEGEEFSIYVNDGDDGAPVDRFNITFDSVASQADKNYTTTIHEAGTYDVTVQKIGFKDASVKITVNPSGISPLYLGIGAVLILVALWVLWTRLLKKRFVKK